MRKFMLWLIALVLISTTSAGQLKPAQKPVADKPASPVLAIVGATLVEVNGKANIPDAVVIIEGNKIKAVGPRAKVRLPRGAELIDARGKYLIPGLIDTHTHSAYDGKDVENAHSDDCSQYCHGPDQYPGEPDRLLHRAYSLARNLRGPLLLLGRCLRRASR